MKIVEINAYILESRLSQAFSFSQYQYDTRRGLLVEVVTDDGLSGWGESFGSPEAIRALINEFKPLVIGHDSTAIEVIWESLYNRYRDRGIKGVVISAISALDIALWDLMGKRHGVPIYGLLGGAFRDRVQAYATGMYMQDYDNAERLFQEEAVSYVDSGFLAMKMKVGFGVNKDIQLVKAVRQVIGPEVGLMIDANHAYDAVAAIRLGRAIRGLEIDWFEEPVCPENLQGYIECRKALTIPIAGGECEWTRFGFREILTRHAMDIIQPDLCLAGGISECRKIAAMSNAFAVRYIPHAWGTGIALAATLQFLAALPPNPLSSYPIEPILEFDQTEHPFRMEVISTPIVQVDGFVKIPQGPGLGVGVNKEAVLRYRVG
jgi:D-galactarolactone cycloisomerase